MASFQAVVPRPVGLSVDGLVGGPVKAKIKGEFLRLATMLPGRGRSPFRPPFCVPSFQFVAWSKFVCGSAVPQARSGGWWNLVCVPG